MKSNSNSTTTPQKCSNNYPYPINQCKFMLPKEGDTSMEKEHYKCIHCGLESYLDYDEMR